MNKDKQPSPDQLAALEQRLQSLMAELGEAQADIAWNVSRRKQLAVTLNQQRDEAEGLRAEIKRLTARVAELEKRQGGNRATTATAAAAGKEG